ncbi:energy-coupling factor transporter transmembrane component T family protein [Microbacterium sp. bgisy189]|uniref:energy-coupling factor transporter transmembrane component T family protein n=1 Tax=Microbacterium sp. bgisy189 TaxID=3413798 RepID=UPI003EBF3611
MSAVTATVDTVTPDPYAATRPARGFLYRLNPLAKMAAPIPAMIALVFVRDLQTPLVFIAVAYALLLIGARLSWRMLALLLLAVPAAIGVIALGMSLWADASRVDQSFVLLQIGEWRLYGGALMVGLATGVRLGAIIALALVAGLTSSGPDIVRATVQQLRVPYRVGYTALAAFRFVPRFAHELDVIRQAHRVRGAHGGRGPFAALARWWGYIVPLLAGAIRHAERVALAMDARAFGAHPDRTERHIVTFGAVDAVFIGVCWIGTVVVMWLGFPWTLN